MYTITVSSNETIICLLTSKVPAHDLIKTGIRYKNTSDISKLETYVIKCENKHTIRHDSKIYTHTRRSVLPSLSASLSIFVALCLILSCFCGFLWLNFAWKWNISYLISHKTNITQFEWCRFGYDAHMMARYTIIWAVRCNGMREKHAAYK